MIPKWILRTVLCVVVLVPCLRAGVFPGTEWDTALPADAGLDAAKLQAAITYLTGQCRSGGYGMDRAVLVRGGKIVWQGADITSRDIVFSVCKSFTGTMLGLLLTDGACSLDDTVAVYAPVLADKYPEMTLRHMTSFTSGYNAPADTPWVPSDPFFTSGTRFIYNNMGMDMLAYVLTKIAGEPLTDLFERRIANVLQMNRAGWQWGDFGVVDGIRLNGGAGTAGRGISVCAAEVARLGLLYLNRGTWDGTKVLDTAWTDQAGVPQSDPDLPPWWFDSAAPQWMADLVGRYGFNFWVNGVNTGGERLWPDAPAGTFAMQGLNDNYCFIIPEWDMVFARLSKDGYGVKNATATYNTFLRYLGQAITGAGVTRTAAAMPDADHRTRAGVLFGMNGSVVSPNPVPGVYIRIAPDGSGARRELILP